MFDDIFKMDTRSSEDRFTTALLHLLQKKPYKDVSVTELCAQAGLSRKTFYKYFGSPDDVLDHLVENLNLGFYNFDYTPPQGMDPGTESFYHIFVYWYHLRDWVTVLVNNNLWQYVARVTPMGAEMVKPRDWGEYLSSSPENVPMMMEFINAGCNQLVETWCRSGWRKAPEEMAALVQYVLSGSMKQFGRN